MVPAPAIRIRKVPAGRASVAIDVRPLLTVARCTSTVLPVASSTSRVTGPSGVPALARQLLDLVDRLAALARPLRDAPDRHEALKRAQLALYAESLAAHGCTLPVAEIARLLEVDLELNAQGLEVWLDK